MEQVLSRKQQGKLAFGQALRNLRHENKLTLREVEEGSGVSYMSISNVERGVTMPSVYIGASLARFYEVDLDELCEDFFE